MRLYQFEEKTKKAEKGKMPGSSVFDFIWETFFKRKNVMIIFNLKYFHV